MQPLELIDTADILLASNGGNPTDSSIRRAMSAVYYGLFHYICAECADRLIGSSPECRRQRAWFQVYRALDHKAAKRRCKTISKENHSLNFPDAIMELSGLLVSLQEKRHEADYNPKAEITALDAETYGAAVRSSISQFEKSKIKHRRAFVSYLLVNHRQNEVE